MDTTPSASISSISITTNVSIQERGLNSPGFHVIDTYHTINCLATGKEKITAPASRSPTSITTINWGYNERGNNSPCWYVIDTYQLLTVYQLSTVWTQKRENTPPPPHPRPPLTRGRKSVILSGHRHGKTTPPLKCHRHHSQRSTVFQKPHNAPRRQMFCIAHRNDGRKFCCPVSCSYSPGFRKEKMSVPTPVDKTLFAWFSFPNKPNRANLRDLYFDERKMLQFSSSAVLHDVNAFFCLICLHQGCHTKSPILK